MSIYAEKCGVDISISDIELQQMVIATVENTGLTAGKILRHCV